MKALFIKHSEEYRECLFKKSIKDLPDLVANPESVETKEVEITPRELYRIRTSTWETVQDILRYYI